MPTAVLPFFTAGDLESTEFSDLAAALAWVSSKRDRGGGFLRRRPPEELDRMVRLCLRLEPLNVGEGGLEGCALFDPSNLFHLRIKITSHRLISPPSLQTAILTSPDLHTLAARARAAADAISTSAREMDFPGLVPGRAAAAVLREAREGECRGAVPPRSGGVDSRGELERAVDLAKKFERELPSIEAALAAVKSTMEAWSSRLADKERELMEGGDNSGSDLHDRAAAEKSLILGSLGRLRSVLESEVSNRRELIFALSWDGSCPERLDFPAYVALLRGRRRRIMFVPPLGREKGGLGESLKRLLGRASYSLRPRIPTADLVNRAEEALGPGGSMWEWFRDETGRWDELPLSPDGEREVSISLANMTRAGILNDRAASETLEVILS